MKGTHKRTEASLKRFNDHKDAETARIEGLLLKSHTSSTVEL